MAMSNTHDQDLPVARSVAREVAAKAAACPFEKKDDPRRAERELGELALKWVLAILQNMGVMREPGETHELDQLKGRLGVVPKYDRYFEALIRRLAGEGLVIVDGRVVETTARVQGYALSKVEEQVAGFKKRFRKRYPGCAGLLGFMACCLGRFEEIVTGRTDVADVLFQEGNMDVFAEVFRGDAVSDYFNRIVAEAVRGTVERAGPGAPKVRIVEIGAGTGGTTAAILEALQPLSDRVELCFSDISQSFIRYARRRFAERYPWLGYRTLNIEKDLSQQGFADGSFDVVVAANVLHDTRDIELTLRQTRRLLKPGGLLVLNEFTSVKDCLFFSGALLHGYWLFEDPERRLKDSCLLSVPQWSRVLERTGFAVVGAFALPTQNLGTECSQSVMLCAAVGTGEAPEAVAGREEDPGKSVVIGRYVEQDILALLGEERSAAYSARRPLMEMGLDSIELVELKSLVRGRFGVKLPPAFLFEHPTQERIAEALAPMVSEGQLRELSPREVPVPEVPRAALEAGRGDGGDIAIVGVACRFPGGATSPEAFWKLLERGEHGIVPLPPGRWQWPDFVDPAGRHRGIDRGGFLPRIDEFDARFFRTSPKEAELMDPQQRLLLELSWEAMEDGGHRPSELAGRKVGVFVGVCQGDYRDVLVAAADAAEGYIGSGSACAMLANRLSYFYDFTGPSLTVDTACSSSLFALHGALAALRRGECEQALVGAVNLLCSPTISISYYQAGMLSPTGRCRTFDAAADGYVRGEGGAMLLLKPLARAVADGDPVYGLVKGTAVNHGGQATTLTAPKPDAQAAVIEAAWLEAGAAPDSVGYVETHGTGTKLGDPIEISGLVEAFRRLYRTAGRSWPAKPHCGLGSVKSNIGHLEGAAGLAGLIKILMSIKHGQLPRTLHFQRLNPEIDLAGSPFYVVERNEGWPRLRDEQGRELPRRASVSSFGFGGANAHAVVEEHRDPGAAAAATAGEDGPWLIPLSARTQEQLIERAAGLLDFVEGLGRQSGGSAGAAGPLAGRVLDDLGTILRRRFGLGEECAPGLEWAELGWGAVETRLFLAAIEEAHGIRLHSRSLIECPSLESLAERIVRDHGEMLPAGDAGAAGPVEKADLEAVAYTLQVGREPMAERAVFLVEDRQGLASALRGFVAGEREIPGCHRGYAQPSQARGEERQEVETGLARRDLPKLAALWVRGAEIDWPRLYPDARPRRVSLPTYPFARERHWPARAKARPAEPASHPLLNQRDSEVLGYRFGTVLTGDEFFLADHVVQGRRMLPAVAYLEMVRAAVERASGVSPFDGEGESRGGIRLRSFTWLRPFHAGRSPARMNLRLTPEGGDGLSFEIYSDPEGGAGEALLHGQGRAGIVPAAAAPALDVGKMRARCTRAHYSAEECYRAFAAMGYEYGPAQRGIDALYVGADEILARLTLPTFLWQTRNEFVLHPAMTDSAVQATIGFALAGGRSAVDASPALPFELQSAEVFRACTPNMWAAIRRTRESGDGGAAGTFDIDLCDENGRVSARFKGWTTRSLKAGVQAGAEPLAGEMILTPAWEPERIESRHDSRRPPAGGMAVVGGTDEQRAAVLARHPEARPLGLEPADGVEELRRKIASWGEVGHVVWVVPDHRPDSMGDDSLIAAQRHGALFGFRLIKAMLAEGYGARPLAWTVITTGTQAVHTHELASPAHASVHGLIGSMAKEHAGWDVRLVDLPPAGDWPWDDLFALAGDPHGNAWAYRDHRWYRQRLVPYRPAGDTAGVYRPGGVYVVIGGAGGIGEAWSEALLRRMPVRLVWIGRRPKDGAIQARLDRLAELGPTPMYIAADATDRRQLEAARDTVKRELGRIDGVIHAAIVLRDKSLANMTEDDFSAGLSPKVDVCVRLAQVFGGEPLDFVLFFSSILAFVKWPGQSNYVAGCTFKDAFAHRLAAAWPCRVRVINWGYWASVGAAASERHRALMAQRGFGSIELPAAMRILDRLLMGPVTQLAYLAATGPMALEGVGVEREEWATHYEGALPSCIGQVLGGAGGEELRLSPAWSLANEEIEASLAELLWAQLRSMRLFPRQEAVVPDRFGRWLERSAGELEVRGYAEAGDPEAAWQSWERRKGEWLQDADWRAHVQLAETALRALPDVLTGRCPATEVLFADLGAGSSMSLIARVYREDPVARFCNGTLAGAVVRYVEERRRQDPGCRIRILEIGAGTGATSESVFEALRAHEGNVEEYAFTDLSRAFLAVAKKALPFQPAYLKLETFDAETPPAEQGIAAGGYDLVIATNVLHATRDIRRTLRNAKAALRTNGLLLLNEIAANSLFHHLTFGLLEGWWLFTDPELRTPGGPALVPETWRAVLEQEGFRSVSFPAAAAHGLGQQVILAESDGFVRQRLAPVSPTLPARQLERNVAEGPPGGRDAPVHGIAEIMGQPRDVATGHLLAHLRLRVAETLGVDQATLDSRSRPFADSLLGEFGMDSLSSNSLRNALRQEHGIDIPVQRIIGEKVHRIVGTFYEQLLLKHVLSEPRQGNDEDTETFVF